MGRQVWSYATLERHLAGLPFRHHADRSTLRVYTSLAVRVNPPLAVFRPRLNGNNVFSRIFLAERSRRLL